MRTRTPIDPSCSRGRLRTPSRLTRTRFFGFLATLGGVTLAATACTSILGDFKIAAVASEGGPGDDGGNGQDVVQQGDGSKDGQGPSTTFDDALQVAAGGKHTCALRADRTVYCWGDNSRGQLGTSSVPSSGSTTPVKVANLTNVRAVASGDLHSCAVTFDPKQPASGGKVFCWGDNTLKQLGAQPSVGDMSAVPVPVQSPSNASVDWNAALSVAAGANTNCGVDASNSSLYCWGDNTSAQIGTGSTSPAHSAQPLAQTPTVLLQGTEVSPGLGQACAIGQAPSIGANVVSTICWGGNQFGEVGSASAGPLGPTWTAPGGATDAGAAPYKRVGVGRTHSCSIDANLDVFCWGQVDLGECGPNTPTAGSTHTPSVVPQAHGALTVGGGEESTCALMNNFGVKCWGRNQFGELGNGTTDSTPQRNATPVDVTNLTGVGQLSVGSRHACAVVKQIATGQVDNNKGPVVCWGSGENGRLGNGGTDTKPAPEHVKVPAN